MSQSSYSASERRGIIAIAFIAIILIGSGIVLGIQGNKKKVTEEIPIVIEHAEMIDSTVIKTKDLKKSKKKKKSSGNNLKKGKKSYRKRSPLDEPV